MAAAAKDDTHLEQAFPWLAEEPEMRPSDACEESEYFAVTREELIEELERPARETVALGLLPMPIEIAMYFKSSADPAWAEHRQQIWDQVFPDSEHTGEPFELAVPDAVRFHAHVDADQVEMQKWLPDGIVIFGSHALSPEGFFIRTIAVDYDDCVLDDLENRIILAMSYDILLTWARTAVVTGRSRPLSEAFEKRTIAAQNDFTVDELQRCAEALAIKPWVSAAEHAVYRVSNWLEQQVHLTLPKDRYQLLRKWCKTTHVNLESLTPQKLREACSRAWMDKIQEWKEQKRKLRWK